MATLAPAHPVYAAQEDRTQRDRQAEAQADAYFEQYLRDRLPDESSAEPPTLSDTIMDALRDLFIAGWNAAREEQRRDGPIVNGERFAPGYTTEAAAYEQRTRAEAEDRRDAERQAAKDRARPEEHDRWPSQAGWVGASE